MWMDLESFDSERLLSCDTLRQFEMLFTIPLETVNQLELHSFSLL